MCAPSAANARARRKTPFRSPGRRRASTATPGSGFQGGALAAEERFQRRRRVRQVQRMVAGEVEQVAAVDHRHADRLSEPYGSLYRIVIAQVVDERNRIARGREQISGALEQANEFLDTYRQLRGSFVEARETLESELYGGDENSQKTRLTAQEQERMSLAAVLKGRLGETVKVRLGRTERSCPNIGVPRVTNRHLGQRVAGYRAL